MPALPGDLEAGYHRFRATRYASHRERWRQLGEGDQRPTTVVVACSDSRSAPEIVFDAGPGELFVVRNIAALVPPYEPDQRRSEVAAALEFAVLGLEVRSIVVMGHGRCGGIAAALSDEPPLTPGDFVGGWVTGLRDLAGELAPSDWVDPDRRHRALEGSSIEQSLLNLRTYPWIRSREHAGSLGLHGAWFDIAGGELHGLTGEGWVRLADA